MGFARMVTDQAVFAYITDVFVLPDHRGNGLSAELLRLPIEHPDVADICRQYLATADAHTLYEKLGFHGVAAPGRWLERRRTTPLRHGPADVSMASCR